MKKIVLSMLAIFLIHGSLLAQSPYVDNALKFSMTDYTGTARFTAMNGAFGALGGDISSLAINPGGLGVFRNTELMFSPGLTYHQSSASYLNTVTDDNKYRMGINNIGLVSSYDLEDSDTRWVNVNFAVGYNKINNFNQHTMFTGNNDQSIMEYFVANAEDAGSVNNLDGMYELLLYNTYLIDYDTINNEFWSQVTDEKFLYPDEFNMNKQKVIQTEGSVGEIDFAFGGNYAHKLYVGFNISIHTVHLSEVSTHYEYETHETDIYDFSSMRFKEETQTNGAGVSLKLGAIYKPFDFLRIGGAFHLPTFYSLEENFNTRVDAYYDNGDYLWQESNTLTYEYNLTTPVKAIGSVGFQIGKIGLVDVDYEYVDYSTMKLDDDQNTQGVIQDNKDIESIFTRTHHVRAGAEFRTGVIYYRAGAGYMTSPFKQGHTNENYDQVSYSAGLGYREKNFFVDFAFKRTMNEYSMIDYPGGNFARIDHSMNHFILTAGIKF
ncbi:MAG: hypothetical protein V2I54_03460 [Bacteroidales bacterium]|jgi:hypothetical protein|nr:hypothetical protein [Bacteroidales bacterium]